jgi:prepilin-type N-terminal cleavage/methylation domain-containing protein
MINRRAHGFTLFESILVLSLVGILAGSVFGFLWNVGAHRDALLVESSRGRAATALFDRVESDIMGGMVGVEGIGAGVQGEPHRVRLLSRGVAMPTPVSPRPNLELDLQATECLFQAGAGEIQLRRWNIGDASEPALETLCRRVQWASFSYFDGQTWKESFDSLKEESLPVAIEIAVWFGEPNADGLNSEPTAGLSAEDRIEESPLRSASDSDSMDGQRPSRPPDRARIIIVPDGPVSSWKEAR